jgi:hypothetical protein
MVEWDYIEVSGQLHGLEPPVSSRLKGWYECCGEEKISCPCKNVELILWAASLYSSSLVVIPRPQS